MPETPAPVDRLLSAREIQDLADADALVAFLSRLGYRTDVRQVVTPQSLGLEAEATVRPIRRLELVARHDDDFFVYLVEVSSITRKHTRALAQAFRNRAGNFVLLLTADYERLDFVCLERFTPTADPAQETLFSPALFASAVRERIWSVERRKPTAVDLRVLRRFSWTEPDSYAQHAKLVLAYDVGFWSSELFNNRALFSDHFLSNRLKEYPEWGDDPRPAQRRFRELFRGASGRLAGKPAATLWAELYQPALEALGFGAAPLPEVRLPQGPSQNLAARALLGERSGPLLLALPWGRFLDGRDESGRDPETGELNPGALVVHWIERTGAPWVVLTNGRLWRLYSRRAHSRATNYYEIDLEETMAPEGTAAVGPGDSFRYFWLLFRRQAFELQDAQREGQAARECLLDRLFLDSQEYTKKLGERLKDKVFLDVFPLLAKGFAETWERNQLGEKLSQEQLDEIYRGTLTLLYRLLFLLYAEARDLLPVHGVVEYFRVSLSRLRREVAEVAGLLASEAPARLETHYSRSETGLYERLLELFAAIDRGRPEANVPAYNGGLFLSQPQADDTRPEADAARFLLEHRVPDVYLAKALDRLARDEDDKSAQLVVVDYKSLGVRQLGSIYEGLLEFRLRRAAEPMALVKGKRKGVEEVHPLSLARSKGLQILRAGRGSEAEERLIEVGATYLENDRHERKRGGVYYTPDFIVSYIVAQTVGPLLHQHLESLRPRLREAERWHRQNLKHAAAKGEPRSKYEAGPAVEKEWQELLSQLFDFTVLDPAMGSGHFLVEVVDFITDRMLDFLSAFPWNPVFAHVKHLRSTILAALDAQGITVDERRLTDVNLVKRHVLKRCVYGVDLNPMAVELAKVSLWLDCFTLGAPLSFLDHHLKWGNSLVGFEVEPVRQQIEGSVKDPSSQLSLFGSRFAGLQLATAGMAVVGGMPDVTTEQVYRSQEAFDRASETLSPFVRILDLYASVWFGIGPAPAGRGKAKKPAGLRAAELLRMPELQGFLSAPNEASAREALDKTAPTAREVVEAGLERARSLRFFHWDLAFPEVFYRSRPGTEHQVVRLPEFGFHAIVGNPPWVRQESVKQFKPALAEVLPEVFKSEADLYVYFLARSGQLLARGGRLGMIVPNKWFKAEYAEGLRHYLSAVLEPLEVVDFGHAPIFEEADTFPAVLLLTKPTGSGSGDSPEKGEAASPVDFVRVNRDDLPIYDLEEYNRARRSRVARSRLRRSEWELLPGPEAALMDKIRNAGVPLAEYAGGKPFRGVLTGFNEAFLIDQATRDRLVAEDPGCTEIIKPFLRGENIRRWHSPWAGEWMIFARRGISIDKYPSVKAYLSKFREALEPKPSDWLDSANGKWPGRKEGSYKWFELQDTIDYYEEFERPKLIYKDLSFHSEFTFDESNLYTNDLCFIVPTEKPELVGILNSSLAWWYLSNSVLKGKDEALRLKSNRMELFPIPRRGAGQTELVKGLTDSLLALKKGPVEPEKSSEQRRRIWELEVSLHHAVFELYGLTSEDIALLRSTAPPRDPLLLAERELAALENIGHG